MRNNGLTITELTIVIAISTIVALAIGFNFVAANYFRNTTENTVEVSREARIALNHISRTLRFADPDPSIPTPITAGANQITATIEGGHFRDKSGNLTLIQSDTVIRYERDTANDTLEYTYDLGGASESTVVIAGSGAKDIDITYFDGIWYGTPPEIEVKLTAEKDNRSISVQTRILVLGEQ